MTGGGRLTWAAWTAVAIAATPAVAFAEPGVAPSFADGDDYVTDDRGRRFRTSFDPGSRWTIGAGVDASTERRRAGDPEGGPGTAVGLETGFVGRNAVDLRSEGLRYKLYHRALDLHLSLPIEGEETAFEGTLYDARFSRWSEEGSIVLPTSPPQRLPFPFGLGFRGELGRLALGPSREQREHVDAELAVTQVEIRLDLWRRRSLGSYAELGFASSYRIDVWSTPVESPRVEHLVAPFTLGTLTFHHESDDGHHILTADVEAGGLFAATGDRGLTARARVGYEGVLVAVNDWPVSAFALGTASADELARPLSPSRELRLLSGLRLSAPLD